MVNKKKNNKGGPLDIVARWLRYVFFQERIFSEERKRFLVERAAYMKKREAEMKKTRGKR